MLKAVLPHGCAERKGAPDGLVRPELANPLEPPRAVDKRRRLEPVKLMLTVAEGRVNAAVLPILRSPASEPELADMPSPPWHVSPSDELLADEAITPEEEASTVLWQCTNILIDEEGDAVRCTDLTNGNSQFCFFCKRAFLRW